MSIRSAQVSFSASDELRSALEAEAFRRDETLSATIRRIVAEYLRDAGQLSNKAPPSFQLGANNPRYRRQGSLA